MEKRPKKQENTFFGQDTKSSIIWDLEFFQKNHRSQMMGPIVIYTHAKHVKLMWTPEVLSCI